MATNAKDIIPIRTTHPGSVLKCELQARGIKQKDFARDIGMPAPNLSELIKGKRHITEAIAIKLEKALGISFQIWMNLQNRYNYILKRRAEIDSVDTAATMEEQSISSILNLTYIYKFFGINKNTAAERLSELKKHLSTDINSLQAMESNTVGFFKRSDKLKIDEVNMRTWLLLAWSEAAKSDIYKSYSPDSCLLAATDIAKAANENTLTVTGLKDILNDNGIIFCHIPQLDSAPIYAYSIMIRENPAIVVTYRHNNMDKLAFYVLHEIGHIRQHLNSGKSYISVENDYSSQSPEEKEADEFANNILIPPAVWKSIMSVGSKNLTPHTIVHTIAAEAKKHGISPTIAISRYKHDTSYYAVRSYRSPKIS